jgi:hypothetical protein
MIACFDENKVYELIDIRKAIEFIDLSWRNMSSETIRHCWEHVDILPRSRLRDPAQVVAEPINRKINKELQQFLNDLKTKYSYVPRCAIDLSAEEYIDIDDSENTSAVPDDQSIVQLILQNNGFATSSVTDEIEDDSKEQELISHKDGALYFEKFKNYCMQLKSLNSNDLNSLRDIGCKIELEQISELKQTKILDFFSKQ